MEDEEVLLEEVSDDVFNEALSSPVIYPCVFISGVETEEEFMFFKNRGVTEPFLPLYCSVDGRIIRLGNFSLSLNSLLAIGRIYNYEIEVKRSEKDSVIIDLRDPKSLEKFIHL